MWKWQVFVSSSPKGRHAAEPIIEAIKQAGLSSVLAPTTISRPATLAAANRKRDHILTMRVSADSSDQYRPAAAPVGDRAAGRGHVEAVDISPIWRNKAKQYVHMMHISPTSAEIENLEIFAPHPRPVIRGRKARPKRIDEV
jgi:hypothetical protein